MRHPLFLLAVGLFAAIPAAAEWIAPKAGRPIKTAGPWELRGSSVVFTRADGGLFLLPSSEIDWPRTKWLNVHPARREVSRFVRANGLEIADATTARWVVRALVHSHRARLDPPSAPVASGQPRFVLTDADVAHVVPRMLLPAEQFPATWRRSFDGAPGELVLVGTVENRSETTVRAVVVDLRFLDADGEPIESHELGVEPALLAPGETGEFRYLPSLEGFQTLEVAARGRPGKP